MRINVILRTLSTKPDLAFASATSISCNTVIYFFVGIHICYVLAISASGIKTALTIVISDDIKSDIDNR